MADGYNTLLKDIQYMNHQFNTLSTSSWVHNKDQYFHNLYKKIIS